MGARSSVRRWISMRARCCTGLVVVLGVVGLESQSRAAGSAWSAGLGQSLVARLQFAVSTEAVCSLVKPLVGRPRRQELRRLLACKGQVQLALESQKTHDAAPSSNKAPGWQLAVEDRKFQKMFVASTQTLTSSTETSTTLTLTSITTFFNHYHLAKHDDDRDNDEDQHDGDQQRYLDHDEDQHDYDEDQHDYDEGQHDHLQRDNGDDQHDYDYDLSKPNGHANGDANGYANGHANRHANGHANRHAYSYTNGNTDGMPGR